MYFKIINLNTFDLNLQRNAQTITLSPLLYRNMSGHCLHHY